MIMRTLLLCLSLAVLSAAIAAAVPATGSSNAAIMAAEIALERNDCRVASQNYLAAARDSSDLTLVAHAAQITLDCGQFQIAEQVATRWRALAPGEALAYLTAVGAQLGRAHIAEARVPLLAWLNTRPAPGDSDIVGAIDLLAERSGTDLTLAMLREIRHARLTGAPVQLRLAQLAIDGWDFALSLKYAAAAAQSGAAAGTVQALQMRAHAGLGDTDMALADARALAERSNVRALALPETLLWLGRDAEAEAELLKIHEPQELRSLAERRLALLAIERSDYRLAEERFSALLRDQNTAAMAIYYLALIAERRGNAEDAVRGYELLANTAFDGAARRRVAGIYLRDGERVQALRMLAATEGADITERIGAELASAELLAAGGAAADGAARLDAALQNIPGHPELSYQHAVLLERSDGEAAMVALEALARARPADMNIANALGFTLADHNRDLPRAEHLIQHALRAQPDNPAVLDSMGWVLYRRGQPQAALPLLQRAYRLFHDGDIGAHCGEVLWKLGRQSEASSMWQQALAANPDNEYLAATAHRYVPELAAPKPPPRLGDGPGTTI
jgi:tetratricopeptide (TPR) repeat protein